LGPQNCSGGHMAAFTLTNVSPGTIRVHVIVNTSLHYSDVSHSP